MSIGTSARPRYKYRKPDEILTDRDREIFSAMIPLIHAGARVDCGALGARFGIGGHRVREVVSRLIDARKIRRVAPENYVLVEQPSAPGTGQAIREGAFIAPVPKSRLMAGR